MINKIIGKNNNGKKILIISGVHGNELTPIFCTYLLSKCNLNDYDFKKITIISGINLKGIQNNTREIPSIETNDFNRMFDVEEDIKIIIDEYIKNNDIIIDVHSSPECLEFMLLNQNEYTNSYVNFCKNNNINYLIRYSTANTIKKYCIDLNKISFTLELNKMNYIDYNSAENGKDIILKIIKNCNNLNIQKSEPIYEPYQELLTYRSGIFCKNNKCGYIITKDDEIGKVLDLITFEEYPIIFKKEGKFKIICFGHSSYTDASNPICLLQPI